jgi:molecular chaperone GrpE
MSDTFTTGDGRPGQETDDGSEAPVVRDKRRIDPQTGQIRDVGEGTGGSAAPPRPEGTDLDAGAGAGAPVGDATAAQEAEGDVAVENAMAAELLADLQRLQAEYVNYRKRVERDRDVARDLAVARVLEALMPVLDDVQLARDHGDLDSGPFAAIAEKLESTLGRFGMERFGEVGEPFDPAVHEALMHTQSQLEEGVEVTTVTQVMQPGYKAGDRLLRAARVAVADPL